MITSNARSFEPGDHARHEAGQVVDLSPSEAEDLINSGNAFALDEAPAEPSTEETPAQPEEAPAAPEEPAQPEPEPSEERPSMPVEG